MMFEVNKEEYDKVAAAFEYGEEVYTQNDPNNERDFEEAFVVGIVTGDDMDGHRVAWPLLAIKHSHGFTGNRISSYYDHIGPTRKDSILNDFPSSDFTFWAFDPAVIHRKHTTLQKILKDLENETIRRDSNI